MGQVIYLDGAATEVGHAAPSMRQPRTKRGPASQFVSLGTATSNLLAKVEARMIENGITKP